MSDIDTTLVDSGRRCPGCSEPILEAVGKRGGRPKVWCSPRCRKAHSDPESQPKPVKARPRPADPIQVAPVLRIVPPRPAQAESGDQVRDRLVTVRDRLAEQIDNEETPARDLPALSREYRNVLNALADIDAGEEKSFAEQLARRRKRS